MTNLALDLTLLGFPGLKPDAELFRRPNSKLLEEILYFLFQSYDPAEAQERLRHCWPATNAILSKRFRADVLKWSEELKKSGKLPRECALRKSWLDESVGERLEESLARLAHCLLEREAALIEGETKDDLQLNGHVYALECFIPGSPWNALMALQRQSAELLTKIDEIETQAAITSHKKMVCLCD